MLVLSFFISAMMSDLTPFELQQALSLVRTKYPKKCQKYMDLLYNKLVVAKQQQVKRQPSSKQQPTNKTNEQLSKYDDNESKDSFDFDDLLSEDGRIVPPPFQRHEKVEKTFQPTPTRYEVFDDFNRMVENNQLSLSNSVYDRFGGKSRKLRPNLKKYDRNYQEQIQNNIKRAQDWKLQPNKEYRIYASKIAPRFHSRDQQVRYYEKRLAAKAFCQRGYGLARVEEEYQINGGPVNMQKRRYKTVSTAFISDSFRRFELCLNQDMKKSVRQITGPQMRALYFVFLNAISCFEPVQYHCFRKCVKIAFDLGSVSIYEHEAISFYIAVQMHLKNRYPSSENRSEAGTETVQVYKRARPLDIYAPVEGGGYRQREDQPNEAQFIDQDLVDFFDEEQEGFQDENDL